MAERNDEPPIVVKKKKRRGHGDHHHHGGAWKVAYADFVTAMMAFFLLLWLLNVTTEEQKRGIADYFSPQNVTRATSGGDGLLKGRTLSTEGTLANDRSTVAVTPPKAASRDGREAPPDERTPSPQRAEKAAREELSDDALDRALAEREAERFAAAEERLRQAIRSVPDLRDLARNLLIDRTPEGMRIQIVDQKGHSMFPLGSAEMYDKTRRLLGLVADAIKRLPNKISIKGHTDAKPYRGHGDYTNWELSSDRANASRRALVTAGLSFDRVAYVVGRAAQDPLVPADPTSPRNRRISIVLLHEQRPSHERIRSGDVGPMDIDAGAADPSPRPPHG